MRTLRLDKKPNGYFYSHSKKHLYAYCCQKSYFIKVIPACDHVRGKSLNAYLIRKSFGSDLNRFLKILDLKSKGTYHKFCTKFKRQNSFIKGLHIMV